VASAPTDTAVVLFGKTRRNVLALIFGQPDRSFYLREIAGRAGTGMSQVQRELERLVSAGLVLREKRANQVHFRANPEAAIYDELRGIVTKTFGVADVLREMLGPFERGIRLAFIYGSIAKGTSVAASDIDLLVVTDSPPSLFSVPLSDTGKRLGRNVSMVSYSEEEFGPLLRGDHHFIKTVLEGPKIWLVGNDRILDEFKHAKPRKPRSRTTARI
jgi:predicted nucleotidyltransferase